MNARPAITAAQRSAEPRVAPPPSPQAGARPMPAPVAPGVAAHPGPTGRVIPPRAASARARATAPWRAGVASLLLHGALLAALLWGLAPGLAPPPPEQGVEILWQEVTEEALATAEDSGAAAPPAQPPQVPQPPAEAPPPDPPRPARAPRLAESVQPPPDALQAPRPAAVPPAPTTLAAPRPAQRAAPPPPEAPPAVADAGLPPPPPEVAPPRPTELAALPAPTRPVPPPPEPVEIPEASPQETTPREAGAPDVGLPLPPAPMPPPPRPAEARAAAPPRPATPPMQPTPGIAPLGAPGESERQLALTGAARVTGAVVPPGLLDGYRNPQPDYPQASRARGEQGVVGLVLRVAPSGQVAEVEIGRSSGFPQLDEAAKRAAQRWRFRPAMRDGFPVEGTIRTAVHFRLVQ